jgi:hypothetical protein
VHGQRRVALAEQRAEPGTRLDRDLLLAEHRGRGLVRLGAEDIGQVLHERAAECDVHQLHAAADAEERQFELDGGREQCVLPVVAIGARGAGALVRRLPVTRRVDVGPARDDEAVERAEHRARDVRRDRLGRQQHRDAAGIGDGVDVDLRQERGAHVPDAGLRLLEVGGHADERRGWLRAVRSHAPAPNP